MITFGGLELVLTLTLRVSSQAVFWISFRTDLHRDLTREV
jgi:hypothetical protein